MTRIAKGDGRAYDSPLRAQQADQTRTRILDAALRVMSRGVAGLSVPAVAREAGVSVPTVYRHFGTKGDLLTALYPHAELRAGVGEVVLPRSIDDVRDSMRALFDRLDAFDDLARAAVASPAADEVRHATMPRRLALIRRVADSLAPGLAEAHRDRIARLLVILTASASLRMWRDHLGSSVDEATDDLEWVLRAAIAAATADKDR